MQDGQLVGLNAVDAPVFAGNGSATGYVSMTAAAQILHHSREWLSRTENGQPKWQRLGLNPRRSGRNLLFKESDLYAHLEQQAVRRRGRPRQITANVLA